MRDVVVGSLGRPRTSMPQLAPTRRPESPHSMPSIGAVDDDE
jgi:hypothetical protein